MEGLSLIGGSTGSDSGSTFTAFDPRTGCAIEPVFYSAFKMEVEMAAKLAAKAAPGFARLSNKRRAGFLNAIAENLESVKSKIVSRASLETGLTEARFEGELGRTCGQLRMFADVVADGSWVDARIDHGIPDRKPLPKPDIRSMLQPLGPVAVFCASNFPLAFSVAGGDTASAFAAGCPVVVIGHAAHPGTAELAGKAIAKAVADMGLDEGVFSLIFCKDHSAGQLLVSNPSIKSVGFTGSRSGGIALMETASQRPEPIPVFAEMSSINPVFLLPGPIEERGESIAEELFASFTLGFGQFCTKPGVVVLPEYIAAEAFVLKLLALTKTTEASPLLTKGIFEDYLRKIKARENIDLETGEGYLLPTALSTIRAREFLKDPAFSEEIFGPSMLLVLADTDEEILGIANDLEGQLTATIHGTEAELEKNSELVEILASKAGRLIFNSFPTGVEVCGAMVHGGPFPATSAPWTTSVGKRAIERFTRLIAYQGFPEKALPDELKHDNPLKIKRIEE